jgi:hypothetical protein
MEIDRWALTRAEQFQAEVLKHYEVYEFHPVVAKLQARPEDFQALMAPLLAKIADPQARVATGLAVLRAA